MNGKLVILGGRDPFLPIVYHGLAKSYPVECVIQEDRQDRKEFLKRRIRKLGLATVAGQIGFQAAILPLLRRAARTRLETIGKQNRFDLSPIPDAVLKPVASVNDASCHALLAELRPDVVVLSGTRILSRQTLGCVAGSVINWHTGFTPAYRGVHGGYWALVQKDCAHCGVTVHLVDAGIDTGTVLYQAPIAPGEHDNFATYPALQLAAGLPLLAAAVGDAFAGRLAPAEASGPSKLWSHPTLWSYLCHRLISGVK